MKSPLEDTIWGAHYRTANAVREAFDRIGTEYHDAIVASGVPAGAAAAMAPYLHAEMQGIDFGCGSGVLGSALFAEGFRRPLDGIDISPGMLNLARNSGCYRHLHAANLLLPQECPPLETPYDFAVTVGLIGDYVPYYMALPHITTTLRSGAPLGFAVESRSTPWRPLEKQMADLGLTLMAHTTLSVPAGKLEEQLYQFFVVRMPETASA